VLGGHAQGAQQPIKRLARFHRMAVAVQVDEQYPAGKPAFPHGGVPSLDGEGGLADPGQPGHRRHDHRPARSGRVQQPGQHRQLIPPGR
jgi:hypothetical protein